MMPIDPNPDTDAGNGLVARVTTQVRTHWRTAAAAACVALVVLVAFFIS